MTPDPVRDLAFWIFRRRAKMRETACEEAGVTPENVSEFQWDVWGPGGTEILSRNGIPIMVIRPTEVAITERSTRVVTEMWPLH